MKRLFLRARLRAIWNLLTKPWFVCITANDSRNVQGRYNVSHASFRLLVQVIDPAYEEKEAGAELLKEAQDLLNLNP